MAHEKVDSWDVLEPLYDHFDGFVSGIRRKCGGDAEDIVQDAFMQIKKQLDTGKTVKVTKGLLERTIACDVKNYLRHRAAGEEVKDTLVAITEHPAIGSIAAHEFAVDLEDGIHDLTEREARSFVATELQGASSQEASEALGLTPGAVRERTSQARKSLRGMFS